MTTRTTRTTRSATDGEPPVVGDIVIYHHPATVQNPATESPAVVQAVRDTGAVRLCVFAQGGIELVEGVTQGDALGQWNWEPAPPLTVTALVPDTIAIGAPSTTLQVQGTGFTADSVISFAGHDEPTTLVSATEVTTGIDMSVWLGPDSVPVTVRNGTGAPTAPLMFTFTAAAARETEPPARRARG